MNKKTFTLALLFLCVTLVWLGVNLYWDYVGRVDVYNTFIALLFVVLQPWSGTNTTRSAAGTSMK
mgnify:CR=1 FL=1